MKNAEKIIWSEGMFLRPHHFQRAESYLQNQIVEWGRLQRSYVWGFLDLGIDDAMLRQGCVALSYAHGVLTDGTIISFNGAKHGPQALKIQDGTTDECVVLALPVRRDGQDEVIFDEDKASLARFRTFEKEVDDDNAVTVGPATVQFGRLRLTLMLEKNLTSEWVSVGVVKIIEKQNDNNIKLDAQYIPPTINVANNSNIMSMMSNLLSILLQRSEQISQRLKQSGRINTSDMAEFTLLALVNRQIGLISHLKTLPIIHPESLWQNWIGLATELSTWAPSRVSESHLPIYNHDDLSGCFGKLMLMLRQKLSLVMEENAVQIQLDERSHGLYIATVPEVRMIREFEFVLAVKVNTAGEILKKHFPAQMKISSVTKIRELVQLHLPGIVLRTLPSAPPQIPWHAGYNYFELEKGSEWWTEVEKSGIFALHLAGDFPGLEMSFWGIRNKTISQGRG